MITTVLAKLPRLHDSRFATRIIVATLVAGTLAGCGGMGTRETAPAARTPDAVPSATVKPSVARPAVPRAGSGGYYLNDGPGDNPPANLDQIADAVPRVETLRPANMRPYTVMGQNYTPITRLAPYKERGIASWYGRRYHGLKTASGEIYDMYAMTAAHTVLPIPSYARVTNLANNKSVVVRINDRGPFHSDRLIDLSYTAAHKLGVLGGGRAMVEVETLIADASMPVTPAVIAAPAVVEKPPAPAESAPAEAVAATPPVMNEPTHATPVVAMTAETGVKGMFLQLGAFGSQDNADNYLARLRTQVDWLAPSLHVYSKDGLFRVHAGPYANQASARAAADRLNQTLGIKALVLAR